MLSFIYLCKTGTEWGKCKARIEVTKHDDKNVDKNVVSLKIVCDRDCNCLLKQNKSFGLPQSICEKIKQILNSGMHL